MTTRASATLTDRAVAVEWATFSLILGCYAAFGLVVFGLSTLSLVLAIPGMAVVIALHSSLTHEVLHGHPFRSKLANEALMLAPLGLAIPYNRFRDLHLAHHLDANLTDPYDDPETNYLDPVVWAAMPRWKRAVFAANRTLLGRITLGPFIGLALFLQEEWDGLRRGDRAIWLAWGLHVIGAAVVLALVLVSPMPLWAYLVSAYMALSLLKIRTFLEHQAHDKVRGRTVIIEDRGPLAFLFLNNNLHVVHHTHPQVPWYDLPRLYAAGRARYLDVNEGYVYRSYGEIFRRYFLRGKDPVPHPLWPDA